MQDDGSSKDRLQTNGNTKCKTFKTTGIYEDRNKMTRAEREEI